MKKDAIVAALGRKKELVAAHKAGLKALKATAKEVEKLAVVLEEIDGVVLHKGAPVHIFEEEETMEFTEVGSRVTRTAFLRLVDDEFQVEQFRNGVALDAPTFPTLAKAKAAAKDFVAGVDGGVAA